MSRARPSFLRSAATALGALAGLVGSILLVLGAFPVLHTMHSYLAMLAAFVPYGVVAWVVLLATLVGTRPRAAWPVLVVAGALVLQLVGTAPYWPLQARTSPGDVMTVVTVNTYYGKCDMTALAVELVRIRPDFVVLQEIAAPALQILDNAGAGAEFTYRLGEPATDWGANNMMVLARRPIHSLAAVPATSPVLAIRADLPSGPVTIVAVHATNPVVSVTAWAEDLAHAQDAARLAEATPTVVVGDFNAVREHGPLRQLMIEEGLRDAAEEAGDGWLPTFPADRLIPLIALDHVLLAGPITAEDVWTLPIVGSDHLGVVARLRLGG